MRSRNQVRIKERIALRKSGANVRRAVSRQRPFQQCFLVLPHPSKRIVDNTQPGIEDDLQAQIYIEAWKRRRLRESSNAVENLAPDRETSPAHREQIAIPVRAAEGAINVVGFVGEGILDFTIRIETDPGVTDQVRLARKQFAACDPDAGLRQDSGQLFEPRFRAHAYAAIEENNDLAGRAA